MDDKPFESLNMVPFIDIMLVLLVIVLTTSTFIASGKIPINLPQSTAPQTATKDNQVIEINQQGGVFYNGKSVTLEELKSQLQGIPRDKAFLLRADKKVQLQQFITVADLLNQSGFSQVAVQTEVGHE